MPYHLDRELDDLLVEASKIWQDKNFINLIERYQPELYDAFMSFITDTSYLTLEDLYDCIPLALPMVNGKVKPDKMEALYTNIEHLENERKAWLA